ncbi:MAG TPA: hypothetical protein VLV32_00585 [Burkholderiales bacterium]|nr:hypothetical protein [Burkholderiales bacterium]
MLRHIDRKRVAAIALFAVMFSALSPALAAFRYRAQPAVLAQICTFSGLKTIVLDEPSLPSKPHTKHPIRCAWCSASTSQPGIGITLDLAAGPEVFAEDRPTVVPMMAAASRPAPAYLSQAPPVFD